MVVLVTYLPFYRMHEINEYFVVNVRMLKPTQAIVFIDNVYSEKQKALCLKVLPADIKYVFGNWGSRIATWLFMLRELQSYGHSGDVMFIDSDNLVSEDLIECHSYLLSLCDMGYGVLDYETWNSGGAKNFLDRSIPCERKLKDRMIYYYKVFKRSLIGKIILRAGPYSFGDQSKLFICVIFPMMN